MIFEEFMDTALYYPDMGYYSGGPARIGREGDYYTSSHLHRIFGAMLGRQVEEMWRFLGEPDDFHVVEMGAGMGYSAKDLLAYLKDRDVFAHLSYAIVEPNHSFRLSQQRLAIEFEEKVVWYEGLEILPPFTGCFLSNELLDAFPVALVEMGAGPEEIYVHEKDGELLEVKGPCRDDVKDYLNNFAGVLPPGYRTEVNLRIHRWLEDVSAKLLEGFILTVDYGYPANDYYSDERNRGTLQCYYRHTVNENPYMHIGQQDITAHVNFSALEKWGAGLGLRTCGYCPQGTYLVSLGMDEVIGELYSEWTDPDKTAGIKALILPQGMGESHKVMVQYKGKGTPALRGFAMRNRAASLSEIKNIRQNPK
jgi:SAM-dependent MidA family methyltransferase